MELRKPEIGEDHPNARTFVGMMRRLEIWRPISKIPLETEVLATQVINGVLCGLIDIDENEIDLVVTAGLNGLCGQAFDESGSRPAVFNYCAIGTDGTAPSAGNTALGSEKMRVKGTYSKDAGVGACSLDTTFTIDGTYALVECGLLNAAAAGTLFCRDTYTVKNVIAGDTVKVYYTPTFTAA